MVHVTKLLVVLGGIAIFTGCAFTPQQANLSPTVSVMASDEGKNIAIGVRVIDERPSKSLGRCGSAYGAAAEITSTQDLAMIVQQQVMDGLRKKGFNPVEFGSTPQQANLSPTR